MTEPYTLYILVICHFNAMQASLLHRLNETSYMGLPNLDAIEEAYESINIDLFRKVKFDHALVVLSHCVHDMSSKEQTSAVSACASLLSFVDFCALIINNEEISDRVLSVTSDTDGYWTRSCIQHIINKFLLKHMADAMDEVLPVRQVYYVLNFIHFYYDIIKYCYTDFVVT